MPSRTLQTAPPPRPSQAPPEPAVTGTPKRRARKPAKSAATDARRRVHVTIDAAVATALRERAVAASNTQVLIAAFESDPPPAPVAEGPFASRLRSERREGVYFFLATGEVEHIDRLADSLGYSTRSAVIDAALRRHMLD